MKHVLHSCFVFRGLVVRDNSLDGYLVIFAFYERMLFQEKQKLFDLFSGSPSNSAPGSIPGLEECFAQKKSISLSP